MPHISSDEELNSEDFAVPEWHFLRATTVGDRSGMEFYEKQPLEKTENSIIAKAKIGKTTFRSYQKK